MVTCNYCHNKLLSMPFTCKRCGGQFCTYHRLPEDHKCPALKRGNIYKQAYSKKKSHKKKKYHDVDEHHKREYVGKKKTNDKTTDKIKHSTRKTKNYVRRNLKPRKHHLKGLLKNSIVTGALILLFIILLTNKDSLNEITLWIIQLGGLLLLINFLFIIKYGYKVIKYLYRTFGHSRNHLKIVGIIILLILLLFAFVNRESLFDDLITEYKSFDKSVINPFALSDNFGSDSKFKISEIINDVKKEVAMSSKERSMDAFDYVNEMRKSKGLRALKWDERAYEMAISRAKDMADRNYFSHKTPEGECMSTLKSEFGFSSRETVAENIWMISGGLANPREAVDSWVTSPGHYANLFYADHVSGAIGCADGHCVFNGVNNDPYGLGNAPCHMYD